MPNTCEAPPCEQTSTGGQGAGGATGNEGGSAGSTSVGMASGFSTSSKLDLLLVIDNSRSMANKQALLAESLPAFIEDLVLAQPTLDLQVGVITTSLGSFNVENSPCLNEDGGNDLAHLVPSLTRTQAELGALTTPDASGVLHLAPGGDVATFSR
jgi:hypothetical protein